ARNLLFNKEPKNETGKSEKAQNLSDNVNQVSLSKQPVEIDKNVIMQDLLESEKQVKFSKKPKEMFDRHEKPQNLLNEINQVAFRKKHTQICNNQWKEKDLSEGIKQVKNSHNWPSTRKYNVLIHKLFSQTLANLWSDFLVQQLSA
ncbi:unnamed protein product, partial [Meganyctiphanes norvegica]